MATHRVSEATGDNRRLHPRLQVMEYATLRSCADGHSEKCIIVDVSLGGMQARCNHGFPVGESFHVEVACSTSDSVVIQAEVKYSVPLEGTDVVATGLRVSSNDRHALRQWVNLVRTIFESQSDSLDV